MNNLAGFELFLTQAGNRPITIVRHLRYIRFILREASAFTPSHIAAFLDHLKQQGKSAEYLNSLMTTITAYARFTGVEELTHLKRLKPQPTIKSTLSDSEIEIFLQLLPPPRVHPQSWSMWTLFFSILAYTGMRPGEVASLTVDRVDLGRSVFLLLETKTGIPRMVPIPPNLSRQLSDYITRLSNSHLFQVSRSSWTMHCRKRIKLLGWKRTNISAYSLRHSFITRLLEEDVNLFKVQKIVGHRKIETTAHYTHLTTKDIIQAIEKHPLIRKTTQPRTILQTLLQTIRAFNLEQDNRFIYRLADSGNAISLKIKIK